MEKKIAILMALLFITVVATGCGNISNKRMKTVSEQAMNEKYGENFTVIETRKYDNTCFYSWLRPDKNPDIVVRAELNYRRKMPCSITRAKRIASIRKRHETIPQLNLGHRKKCSSDEREFESVKEMASFYGVTASSATHALKKGHKIRGHKVWYVV